MNDFTKEELMDLKRAVLWVDHEHDELLANKIQSMIDNYCEHESEIDIGEAPLICKKCGKVTG